MLGPAQPHFPSCLFCLLTCGCVGLMSRPFYYTGCPSWVPPWVFLLMSGKLFTDVMGSAVLGTGRGSWWTLFIFMSLQSNATLFFFSYKHFKTFPSIEGYPFQSGHFGKLHMFFWRCCHYLEYSWNSCFRIAFHAKFMRHARNSISFHFGWVSFLIKTKKVNSCPQHPSYE